MKFVMASAMALVMLMLSSCGNCPSGINTTDASCPNYMPYGGYGGAYQQPYNPYGQQPYNPYNPYGQQQPYNPYGQQQPYNPYMVPQQPMPPMMPPMMPWPNTNYSNP